MKPQFVDEPKPGQCEALCPTLGRQCRNRPYYTMRSMAYTEAHVCDGHSINLLHAGWRFVGRMPKRSKPWMQYAPQCNHEPGVDCPAHPMTVENQRPVSAEVAAAIDASIGDGRVLLEGTDR